MEFYTSSKSTHGWVLGKIGTILKTSLTIILNKQAPKENTLRNFLIDVKPTIDPTNQEASTPNHFLLGTTNPGEFNKDDMVLRKQWRIAANFG